MMTGCKSLTIALKGHELAVFRTNLVREVYLNYLDICERNVGEYLVVRPIQRVWLLFQCTNC